MPSYNRTSRHQAEPWDPYSHDGGWQPLCKTLCTSRNPGAVPALSARVHSHRGRNVVSTPDMPGYVPQIPTWFSARKAAQVTAFFAIRSRGRINVLKATKLVYLADRLSMERRDHPITDDNFVSMPFGPVNTYTYSYMTGAATIRQDEWAEFIGPRSGYDLPLRENVTEEKLDELSQGDLRILEEVWATFADIDRFDLAEWTHRFCPEWRDPNGSSIPIDFATVFAKLGKKEPVELSEDIQAERQIKANLFA